MKHYGKELIRQYPEEFSTKFDENKLLVSQLTEGATTRIRNQIAGYITEMYVSKQ
ncbi:MAG: 30S ribosomal protein S17e [Chloroflexota bacterium]